MGDQSNQSSNVYPFPQQQPPEEGGLRVTQDVDPLVYNIPSGSEYTQRQLSKAALDNDLLKAQSRITERLSNGDWTEDNQESIGPKDCAELIRIGRLINYHRDTVINRTYRRVA